MKLTIATVCSQKIRSIYLPQLKRKYNLNEATSTTRIFYSISADCNVIVAFYRILFCLQLNCLKLFGKGEMDHISSCTFDSNFWEADTFCYKNLSFSKFINI